VALTENQNPNIMPDHMKIQSWMSI